MTLKHIIESDTLLKRLEQAGYTSLEDLKNASFIQLTKDVQLSEDEVSMLLSIIHNDTNEEGTLATILAQEQRHGITTSSQHLDKLFAPTNGIPRCSITELSGGPGTGKTQLCIQLACNVQLPLDQGGLDGECIYIDTEGGLMLERFRQVAFMEKDHQQGELKLKRIHHFRILDHIQLIALIRQLPDVLQELPKVKLLILDSIAYHFRLNIRDNRTRAGFVNFIGQSLIQLANQFGLAIVVTNHISIDRITSFGRPALGEPWAQWCGIRLLLTRNRQQRYASIYNSTQPTLKTEVPFIIARTGIDDVGEEEMARLHQWQETGLDSQHEEIQQQFRELAPSSLTSTTTTTRNDQDIWDEQEFYVDDIITEIPKMTPPLELQVDNEAQEKEEEEEEGTMTMEKVEQRYTLVPDSQPGHVYSSAIVKDMIDTSDEPPASQTFGRRQPPLFSVQNKRRRYSNDNTATNHDGYQQNGQSDDDWGSENDELWLAVAGMSSPSL
ncbi:P-loop containing nucleoside triphosphate hydrolase protein [Halteromyces radiatus]|uniref:P-loop containing nucleoside triphosphate hydrolase protein n=1 Tax=Halteromyces radiatus TaxID=101107 RepID=UPI00221EA702|nr:P-loop containing nucleoside triphosphate hydrolase protein [Halteromyces radiatus]KAI8098927.1 P-loop containing nucleoside triphosphate hydrolase protein [Halteromyces radiatus]